MGKYTNLINSLFIDGVLQKDVYDKVLKGDNRIIKYLAINLLSNSDPDIRETCAELLHERGNARAVPALIDALKDSNIYVRQDALWAIEKLCGFAPGGLQDILRLTNQDKPNKLYARVSGWWDVNERFIRNNENLW